MSDPGDDVRYPCSRCGKLRTEAEGGTTFTVCDNCWDATKAPGDPGKDEAAALAITTKLHDHYCVEECRWHNKQGEKLAGHDEIASALRKARGEGRRDALEEAARLTCDGCAENAPVNCEGALREHLRLGKRTGCRAWLIWQRALIPQEPKP